MFTWVCPTCGRELDLATKDCPACSGRQPAAAFQPQLPTPAPVAPVVPQAGAPGPSRLLVAGIALLALAAVFTGWALLRSRAPAAGKPAAADPVAELPAPSPYPEVEIAGVRPFYDAKNQAQVRAVVVNHGETEIESLTLRIALRPRRAPAGSPPLARFVVKIPLLKPETSQEIAVPLEAFGTLASLPAWRELRLDFE